MLTSFTTIDFKIDPSSKPIIFKDKLHNSPNLKFNFSVELISKPLKKTKVEIEEKDLSQYFLNQLSSSQTGLYVSFNLAKSILITIDDVLVELKLTSVSNESYEDHYLQTNQHYLETNPEDHLHHFYYTENSNFNYQSNSSNLIIKKNKDPIQPSKNELPEEGKKEVSLPVKPIEHKQRKLKDFLLEKGIVGLPDDLERILTPIIASHGPLAQLVKDRNLESEKGILLYGPPGTGKTSFARVLAEYLNCPDERLKKISATELLGELVGSTEKNIRNLFEPARQAAASNPKDNPLPLPLHIIVIDEIDSILTNRDKADREHEASKVNQFLTEIDGLNQLNNILVIGMTNNLHKLDPAVVRPGRFGTKIEIGLPNEEQRINIFNLYLQKEKRYLGDISIEALAKLTPNCSGADIKGIVQAVKVMAFNRLQNLHQNHDYTVSELENHPEGKFSLDDFKQAIKEVKTKK